MPEAAFEFGGGLAQGLFRVQPQVAGQVHQGEQHIAEFILNVSSVATGQGLIQFCQFIVYLAAYRWCFRPVEADFGSFLLYLGGPLQGWQARGDAIQGAVVLPALGGAFLLLDGLPIDLHGLLVGGIRLTEHMGMAAHHLVAQHLNHVVEVEQSPLPSDLGMEHHLQQQIPQLFLQFRVVPLGNRLRHLESFFDGIGGNGVKVLLHIPGAAGVRIAQLSHDGQQCFGVRHAFLCW